MEIELKVPSTPVGKGRPRVTRYVTYTPQKTKDYEELVKQCWRFQSGKKLSGALKIEIEAVFEPPKSYSKKKRESMVGTPHLVKPDADNIAKAILDSLNKLAFDDDSSVFDIHIKKTYGIRGS